jgi:hypothetical protein
MSRPKALDIVDQPHIAADRLTPSSLGKDSVYLVWQEAFSLNPSLACSNDSGAHWSAPVGAHGGSVGYPRVFVGGDGTVYVVSRSGATAVIDKFSSCEGGLVRQSGFPVSVSTNPVPCPVPGLDRCNNGNWLSSPTIAVDDTNPSHVYLGWADSNGAGEDILVTNSTDGGKHFGPTVAVNSAVKARRFLPWLTVWGGVAHVGWYDRRKASSAANDLTRYFRGSASAAGGALTPGPEVDLSGVDDPQCASGFPCGVRDSADCMSCSSPPAPGTCSVPFPPTGGCPKYGDYNGDAAGGGRILHVWASATAPPGLPPATGIQAFTAVTTLCGAAGQVCCPSGPSCNSGLVCGGTVCAPCGDLGLPCCANNQCNGTLTCANNQCQCGGPNQPCCDPGSTCGPSLVCSTQHQCVCGGADQPCCFQNQTSTCNDPGLVCDPRLSLCITGCGHRFQTCCKNGLCNAALTCSAGVCSCGARNQPCCLTGAKCSPSLTCTAGHCVGGTDPCGTCSSSRSTCKTNCGTDARCLCLCDNTYCDCSEANGCGPCIFRNCTLP